MTGTKKAAEIARLALDKKASDVVILELKGLAGFTDYFVICSGDSSVHVKTIVEHLQEALLKKKIRPLGIEGEKAGRWVLMDFGDVIVHIFDDETRRYYELEKLWLDAPRLPVEDRVKGTKKAAGS